MLGPAGLLSPLSRKALFPGLTFLGGSHMSQPDIVFARIDNRLVHGQVGSSWVGAAKANLVVVADDEAAADPLQQSLMKMTTDAAGVGIRFFSVQKTIDIIGKASPKQHIFLITRTPAAMRAIIESGVAVKEVNIGNLHAGDGKRNFVEKHVYVDDQDLADLAAIRATGAKVYIQILPTERKYENLALS